MADGIKKLGKAQRRVLGLIYLNPGISTLDVNIFGGRYWRSALDALIDAGLIVEKRNQTFGCTPEGKALAADLGIEPAEQPA